MRKFLSYILCIFASFLTVGAQEVYEQLNLDVAFGSEIYLNDWKSGGVTDVLLNPTNISVTGKIRLNYYFHEHWGVHADFNIATYKGTGNKKDIIPSQISYLYINQYYIENPQLITDKTHIYMRVLAGAQYRWERNNWSIIPRLSIGFAHTPVDHCSFILKGIGNNQQYFVEYYTKNNKDTEYGIAGRAILNPGIQFAYKLKHLHLTLDLGYMQYLNKLRYQVETTELYIDGTHSLNEISSKHAANKFNFSLGVLIPLSWKIK